MKIRFGASAVILIRSGAKGKNLLVPLSNYGFGALGAPLYKSNSMSATASAEMHSRRLEPGNDLFANIEIELAHRPRGNRSNNRRSTNIDSHPRQRSSGNDLQNPPTKLILN